MAAQLCKCVKILKKGHDRCHTCFLRDTRGEEAVAKYIARKKKQRITRMKNRPRRMRCEMGWASCEARGFCNGDC